MSAVLRTLNCAEKLAKRANAMTKYLACMIVVFPKICKDDDTQMCHDRRTPPFKLVCRTHNCDTNIYIL